MKRKGKTEEEQEENRERKKRERTNEPNRTEQTKERIYDKEESYFCIAFSASRLAAIYILYCL